MSETKHTPGPWSVEPDFDSTKWWKVTAADGNVCVPCYGRDMGLDEANARLIAAAPELLAALNLYVEHYGDPLKVARAAIAKAEGK